MVEMLSERDSEERVKVGREHIVTETHAGQTAERAFTLRDLDQRVRAGQTCVRTVTRGQKSGPGWRGKEGQKEIPFYMRRADREIQGTNEGSGVQKQEERDDRNWR